MGVDKRVQHWIIIAIVLIVAIVVPLLKVNKGEPAIRQGIDLVGGVDLLLQAQVPQGETKITGEMMQGAINIVRNRLDPEGVKEIVIQQLGEDRIVVEIPGEGDPERVKRMIGTTATLRFINASDSPFTQGTKIRFIDAVTGEPIDSALKAAESAPSTEPLVLTVSEVLYKPEDFVGFTPVSAPSTPPATTSTSAPEVPSSTVGGDIALAFNQTAAIKLTADTARLKGSNFALVVDDKVMAVTFIDAALTHSMIVFKGLANNPSFIQNELNADLSRVKIVNTGSDAPPVGQVVQIYDPMGGQAAPEGKQLVNRVDVKTDQVILTGDDFKSATVTYGQMGQSTIAFEFKPNAGQIFGRFTSQHVHQYLAIALDDTIISCPIINEAILGGKGVIEGKFTPQEAQELVVKLNSGRLPVQLSIIENRSIGPTLGQKSINESKRAALAGAILVVLFMLLYYRFPGFMANISLVFYCVVVFGAMSLMGSTLTLPGIAGFVMSIGMAVDANIIIFERLKEELLSGKTFRAAIDVGFKRAFSAVFDSHMTSIMAGIVLYNLGTGPIKGFAVTLTLGCLTSLFSAITVTRTLLDTALDKEEFQSYWLFGVKAPKGIAKEKGGEL
jgi:protein-export membrane protein SecD